MADLEENFSAMRLSSLVQSDESLLQESIKVLKENLNDQSFEFIQKIFRKLFGELKTFDHFENIFNCYSKIINLLDGLMADVINGSREKFMNMFYLKELASEVSYSKRIVFMGQILEHKNEKEIFFSSCLTEEEIKKRYRKLAFYFHPDKTSNRYISIELQKKYKKIGEELFKCISKIKDDLLSDLNKSSKMSRLTSHEEKGNKFWKLAIDYRNAHKKQWKKLKHLKIEELIELSAENLKKESISKAHSAYREYRAACKLADETKNFEMQIKLRGYIALSLYILDQFQEAQLYALSGVKLVLDFSNKIKFLRKVFDEAKSIFYKVNLGNPREKSTAFEKRIKQHICSDNQIALVNLDQEFSYSEKISISHSINDDLEKIMSELMIKVNRDLVNWQANSEDISLHPDSSAYNIFKTLGVCVGIQVGIYGVPLADSGYVMAVASGAATPIIGAIPGIGMIGIGLFCGYAIWKKSEEITEERAKICEAFNEFMKKELKAYEEEDHQTFFNELTGMYNNDVLIKLGTRKNSNLPSPEVIIEALLSYGFRPDGIAYLLNLIGEVVTSGKIEVKDTLQRELKEHGVNVWKSVLSEELLKQARKLDDRIKASENESFKLIDFLLMRKKNRLTHYDVYIRSIYKDDEKPFISRLEEMRNTAKINLAIRHVLNCRTDEIVKAKEYINEVRNSINSHHQYFYTTEMRLEVLEDFLWIISGDQVDPN